jgi:imidazole glycerol-phosphate synthase subunit HisH
VIAIVDYGMGNRRSLEKALAHVGAQSTITADHETIASADAVILPGVGAFPEAMRHVNRLGLAGVLTSLTQPLLGICLGMQLLFESSTEHEGAQGLGILPGVVTPLESPRLPHIGWNLVTFERESSLTDGIDHQAAFYHVHSFACRPSDPQDIVGTSEYGERFVSVVERGNVVATQFHPEKSSRDGLRLLRNFAARVAVA